MFNLNIKDNEKTTNKSGIPQLTDLDRGVAENSIENDPYTFESNWMLKKALFSKLTDHPQLLTDSLMAEYYANLQNSLIDQIVEVEKSKEILFNKDSGEVSTMEQSLVSFNSLIDQLDNQLVQLHDVNVSGLSNQTVIQNIQSIQNDLFSLIEVSDNLNTRHDSLRVILASDIEFENNQLPTTEVIENNERIVNEIYLNSIGKDNFSFAPDQVMALRSIANQCPLSGGSGVFRARGLLFIAFGELCYNDREICNMEGIELKQTQSGDLNHTQVTIKPNPSNELTSVTYDFSEESSIDYNLYSSTGSRIDHKELVGGKQTFTIPTSKLLPGVYFISLTGANGQNFKGKIVVIR